jgi:hypothetical protein
MPRLPMFIGPWANDLERYAPVECQKIEGGGVPEASPEHRTVPRSGERRYVRLSDQPMPARECLGWLIENGYVKREPDDHPESETGYRLVGWGSTYFMVPWERSVERS